MSLAAIITIDPYVLWLLGGVAMAAVLGRLYHREFYDDDQPWSSLPDRPAEPSRPTAPPPLIASEVPRTYVDMGVKSPNEVRAEMGYEPYEGGDGFLNPPEPPPAVAVSWRDRPPLL